MNDSVPVEITEAAADWLDRLSADAVAVEERESFAAWLRQSPVHVAEFLRVSAMRATVAGTLADSPDWAEELLESAQDAAIRLPRQPQVAAPRQAHEEAVSSRPRTPARVSHKLTGADADVRATPGRASLRRSLAVAAALVIAIAAGVWMRQIGDAPVVTTAIGEQRVLLLDDGSTLRLNTDSVARLGLRQRSREIELLRGELMVNVATDPERPFRVRTDDAVVEAMGTRFNVYRRGNATEVTVVEGRVRVDWEAAPADGPPPTDRRFESPGSPAPAFEHRCIPRDQRDAASLPPPPAAPDACHGSLELAAGYRATVGGKQGGRRGAPVVSQANIERAMAWTERRIDFDGQTVEAVVAEFNRYNPSRILVDDPQLAKRRISGVFDVNNPEAFVALLGGLNAIEIEFTLEGHRTIRYKKAHKEN